MKPMDIVYLGWDHNYRNFIKKYNYELSVDWYTVGDFKWNPVKKDLNGKILIIGIQCFFTKYAFDEINKYDCICVQEEDFNLDKMKEYESIQLKNECHDPLLYVYHSVSRFELMDI